MEVRHFRSWFAQSSSNSHNFFVSTLNWAPFEVLDSWLPKLWNNIWYAWNGLQKVLRNVSNRGASATFPSWCVHWRILRHGGFATISQLQNECTGLPNGTHVPKGGFAVVKHPSKWRLDYEMEDFKAWRFPSHFIATKRVYLAAKWYSCSKGPLPSCENFRRGR